MNRECSQCRVTKAMGLFSGAQLKRGGQVRCLECVAAHYWSCSACTFENASTAKQCQVCEASRPAVDDAPPALHERPAAGSAAAAASGLPAIVSPVLRRVFSNWGDEMSPQLAQLLWKITEAIDADAMHENWMCSTCEFSNVHSSEVCEPCGTPKPPHLQEIPSVTNIASRVSTAVHALATSLADDAILANIVAVLSAVVTPIADSPREESRRRLDALTNPLRTIGMPARDVFPSFAFASRYYCLLFFKITAADTFLYMVGSCLCNLCVYLQYRIPAPCGCWRPWVSHPMVPQKGVC
jgi:hypothetical protein